MTASASVDWTRFRTVGFDLILVGVLVIALSLSLAVYTLCPQGCPVQVDWPTLSPGMTLLAAGVFLTYMARKQKKEAS